MPIFKHINIRLLSAKVLGPLKITNFPFGANGNFIIVRHPILKNITVIHMKMKHLFIISSEQLSPCDQDVNMYLYSLIYLGPVVKASLKSLLRGQVF